MFAACWSFCVLCLFVLWLADGGKYNTMTTFSPSQCAGMNWVMTVKTSVIWISCLEPCDVWTLVLLFETRCFYSLPSTFHGVPSHTSVISWSCLFGSIIVPLHSCQSMTAGLECCLKLCSISVARSISSDFKKKRGKSNNLIFYLVSQMLHSCIVLYL